MEDGFFRKITIVGVGLIGGSIGLNLKSKTNPPRVIGLGRRESSLQKALECQAVDQVTTSLKEAVENSDLIVLCTPVGKIIDYIEQLSQIDLPENCLITDAGSIKGAIVDACLKILPAPERFIPAHPMAGSENSGVEHADVDLFICSKCLLTPLPPPNENIKNIARVQNFWEVLGCDVKIMDAHIHDRLLAVASHLPHILAPALALTAEEVGINHPEIINTFAGSFRDATRVALSEPLLWQDIFSSNRNNILEMIHKYQTHLGEFEALLANHDLEALNQLLSQAKLFRDKIYHEK